MTEIDQRLPSIDPLLLKGLGHLITDGVENDRGMVEIPLHHSSRVALPPIVEVHAIVIGVLAVVPHVEGLVHDVHAVFVAGVQQRPGSRIVGGTNRVEAVFLQDAHPSFLALGVGRGAEDTAVVVDAAAAQQSLPAIDEQSLVRPGDLTDAEGNLYRIVLTGRDLCGIEIRRFVAPELCVGDRELKACALAAHAVHIRLDGNGALDLHDSRIDGYCAYLHALRAQASLFADMQPHGAVDAGAGIPAGVGESGVVRDHGQCVLTVVNQICQFHKEARVAVGMEAELFTVERNRCVFIYALELDEDILSLPLSGSGKDLFIGINASGEIPVSAVGNVRTALLADLRVMRQRDSFPVASPTIVERIFLHACTPFTFRSAVASFPGKKSCDF